MMKYDRDESWFSDSWVVRNFFFLLVLYYYCSLSRDWKVIKRRKWSKNGAKMNFFFGGGGTVAAPATATWSMIVDCGVIFGWLTKKKQSKKERKKKCLIFCCVFRCFFLGPGFLTMTPRTTANHQTTTTTTTTTTPTKQRRVRLFFALRRHRSRPVLRSDFVPNFVFHLLFFFF